MTGPSSHDAARGLQTPLQYLKGVGPHRAKLLSRLGLGTIEDALFFIPARHEDRSRLTPFSSLAEGKAQSCSGTIVGVSPSPRGNSRTPFSVLLQDPTGYLTAVWFNQPYLEKVLRRGQTLLLHGRVARFRGGPLQMQHPDFEIVEEGEDETLHTGRLVPIYRLTEGLTQRPLRTRLWRVVDEHSGKVLESLPDAVRERRRLVLLPQAVRGIHFPQTEAELAAARRRLVFDDFLLLQLGFAIRRQREGRAPGLAMRPAGELVGRLRRSLAYTLTAAQERVWEEIRRDLAVPYAMNRLLQGDVGSGKTIVAAMAILTAVEAGYQTAMMAPTEILAEQHLLTFQQLLPPLGVPVALLTSAIRGRERETLLEGVAGGGVPCLVGTHALIQEGVEFHRLGLAVVDEQHRFGVVQRAMLRAKGGNPHVLVMTATPIPRTLALTLYGDLDVSVIDEMPPGRQSIVTVVRAESKRPPIYAFLRGQIKEGRQVYVVCPLVEESEASDLKAATEMAERLQLEIFSDLTVGLLHGRMGLDEKAAVMRAFKAGEIHILVSTTVIEVGIDVPNASVMLVEHAERFGLSQLHQLRGRVGRGPWKSYCILLESGTRSAEARRRLEAMCETQDGFRIAEVDLELRGPGDFFGTRQSGLPEFRAADLLRDGRVLEEARQEAFAIVAADPDLAQPEHRGLRAALLARWRGKLDLASVG
ncbi:MAG: ATP-dependent DNA helicase RecG [Candidatus Rokubacteria bacterium]|nr:ATP-dependent DNA helicase RecG [Candidatus Rokubacteria bacterium]